MQHIDESTRRMIEEEAKRKQEEGATWSESFGYDVVNVADLLARAALEASGTAVSTACEVGCAAAEGACQVGGAVLSGVAEVLSGLG